MADNDNKNLKEIEAAVRAKKDDVEVSKELNALSEKNLELLLEAGNLSAKNQGIAKEILLQKQKEIESLGKQRELLENIANLNDKSYASAQARQMLDETAADFRRAKIRSLEKEFSLEKDITAERREQIAKDLKDLKKQEAEYKLLDKVIPDIFKRAKAAPLLTAQGLVLGAASTWLTKLVALAKDLHDTEAAFMKTTGASKDFASSISDVYGETRKYGVATKDVSDSMAALHAGFTDFTFASKAQRESLSKTGAVWEKWVLVNKISRPAFRFRPKHLVCLQKQLARKCLIWRNSQRI